MTLTVYHRTGLDLERFKSFAAGTVVFLLCGECEEEGCINLTLLKFMRFIKTR